MKPAYYNELDPAKAAWLRELIRHNHIAPGDVDERSIADVRPDDLCGYGQCHFFAGIGIWSYALRLAGWDDSRPVWTGSCPCPSFSAAGKGEGFDDPRHLWPVWMPLIGERRPPVVFGEQADAAIGHGWLDLVSTDLEASAYAVGAAVLGACSVGAPHRRQRLYFVADAQTAERRRTGGAHHRWRRTAEARGSGAALLLEHPESLGRIGRPNNPDSGRGECSSGYRSEDGGLADAERGAAERQRFDMGAAEGRAQGEARERQRLRAESRAGINFGGMADTGSAELEARVGRLGVQPGADGASRTALESRGDAGSESGRPGPLNGYWSTADWIFCRDRRWRPVEPGTFPLAHGAPARMVRLRGYGDGITAQTAAAFISAYMDLGRAA